ncbi:MAG: hypothetical protein Q7R43_01555 [Candidatus Daviesbacteria bacterium]|nr:hypothetical protein [Candidatus Daviesbacteria bacterium]
MAERFKIEALKREEELEKQQLNGYLKKLVDLSKKALQIKADSLAEDALMYSTLFQNFALKKI